jgi:MFS family permease
VLKSSILLFENSHAKNVNPQEPTMRKIHTTTIITSIGSALEYYDFVTYIMLASFLKTVFFPETDHLASMLNILAIFALGYIARPLGGVVFGYFGDRYGRKTTFLLAVLLMAFSILGIGLLPGYNTLGVFSPILLVIFRFIQGISQGAELPGAITFICEHAESGHKGKRCGQVFMGVGVGSMLSAGVNYLLTTHLTHAQILAWGWRLPFLLGAVLAIVGYYLRRKTMETPAFEQNTTHYKMPIVKVFEVYPQQLIMGFLFVASAASIIMFMLFMPTYLQHYTHLSVPKSYLVVTAGMAMSVIFLPLFGMLSDKVGRRWLLMAASFLQIVGMVPLFYLLHGHHVWAPWAFIVIYEILISAMAACYPPMLADLFPTAVRYTGVGICYNVTYALAAFVPMLATLVLHHFNNPMAVAWLLAVFGALSFVATVLFNPLRSAKQ